jgi:murein L,D-transpeptidase YafK
MLQLRKSKDLRRAGGDTMRLVIRKKERSLRLMDGDAAVLCARVGLGRCPEGAKARAGDGKTPEGVYAICLVKPDGKYGRSLGLSYPNREDARLALLTNVIDPSAFRAVERAAADNRRPPWGTAMGGEIYIHEGGSGKDWTEGCIALDPADMDALYPHYPEITEVEILP